MASSPETTAEILLETPSMWGKNKVKYKSNPNFEAVRQGVVALLNSYDPEDSVVDNYEVVKTSAIKEIESLIKESKTVLEEYQARGLTNNANRQEDYLKGCYDCLERINQFL